MHSCTISTCIRARSQDAFVHDLNMHSCSVLQHGAACCLVLQSIEYLSEQPITGCCAWTIQYMQISHTNVHTQKFQLSRILQSNVCHDNSQYAALCCSQDESIRAEMHDASVFEYNLFLLKKRLMHLNASWIRVHTAFQPAVARSNRMYTEYIRIHTIIFKSCDLIEYILHTHAHTHTIVEQTIRSKVVKEWFRVLKPGGKVYFVDSAQEGEVLCLSLARCLSLYVSLCVFWSRDCSAW